MVAAVKALVDSVSFIKERGSNDNSLVFPLPIYKHKHVHICIVALTKKVTYECPRCADHVYKPQSYVV